MRAVIIANGWLGESVALRSDDLLIAADGGALHCLKLGLHPDAVIGDLDSLDDDDLIALENIGTKIIRYPERKDYTDLDLALRYAQDQGVSEILVLAALGARWDQTVANILLPTSLPHIRISLIDGPQEIFYVHSRERLEIRGHPGDTVSLIPLAGDVWGITTSGMEYPLHDDLLKFGSTRGISNVLLEESATISLKEGLLLCIVIHA